MEKYIKPRKYIISSNKFEDAIAASCPCIGQVATNSKLIAYFLYCRWKRFSYRNLRTISVTLWKRNQLTGKYEIVNLN